MITQKDIKTTDTKPKYTIKQIFADHWQLFLIAYAHLNIRKAVFRNVDKI